MRKFYSAMEKEQNKHLDAQTLRKLQLVEVKALDEVRRICEKHDLKYFLIAGTLIGAIRHKGFIPWDDDIDIGMLRSDYNKFIEYCKTDLDTGHFFLQSPSTEKGSADFGLLRIRINGTKYIERHRKNLNLHSGIFVEIFPYDDLPDNELHRFFYSYSFYFLKKAAGARLGYKYGNGNPFKEFIVACLAFFTKIIPLNKLIKLLDNYQQFYQNPDSKWVFLIAGGESYKKEKHLRKTVSELSTAEFEGKQYPVPKDYDTFLTEQYGDYMTPPPEDKRVNDYHTIEEVDFGNYQLNRN